MLSNRTGLYWELFLIFSQPWSIRNSSHCTGSSEPHTASEMTVEGIICKIANQLASESQIQSASLYLKRRLRGVKELWLYSDLPLWLFTWRYWVTGAWKTFVIYHIKLRRINWQVSVWGKREAVTDTVIQDEAEISAPPAFPVYMIKGLLGWWKTF